jgi:hypothetical protein
MGSRGGTWVSLMIIFCVLAAAFSFDMQAIGLKPILPNATTVVITSTAVVPESICVIRLGIEEPNGTVIWTLGYAYPGLPPSQCQDKTEHYTDVLGRTVVAHQFLETRIFFTIVTETLTV